MTTHVTTDNRDQSAIIDVQEATIKALRERVKELEAICRDVQEQCAVRNEGGSGEFIPPPSRAVLKRISEALL